MTTRAHKHKHKPTHVPTPESVPAHAGSEDFPVEAAGEKFAEADFEVADEDVQDVEEKHTPGAMGATNPLIGAARRVGAGVWGGVFVAVGVAVVVGWR